MASLGTGVIILIVIWVITLASLTLFTFAQSSVKYIGLLSLVIAVIITLVLTLLPRGEINRAAESIQAPSSTAGLARILILTFLCVTFLVGLLLVFCHEVLPPVYALPVRKRFVR
ncbi:unnamed protein product [Rotaria magnacalcarata]|uniref:Transmembrane protein 218 n=1 Tax=Rotaria magnacalcarata TaxID=392030 RepID=A0A816KC35_9BILA|nr:unnamed protein product [Rotaria magnacalcarata]CAF1594636.1 unnamed protein product [Rotaria magnacalcarata]CAF1923204.1 unnamed protein product [Rotaria magnacalcarata]CAF2114626.1 unnamed protein product [Rotaria magnacalcarata]CAF2148441.1 unnamed protein product [Rotaria magnacalcarata]